MNIKYVNPEHYGITLDALAIAKEFILNDVLYVTSSNEYKFPTETYLYGIVRLSDCRYRLLCRDIQGFSDQRTLDLSTGTGCALILPMYYKGSYKQS